MKPHQLADSFCERKIIQKNNEVSYFSKIPIEIATNFHFLKETSKITCVRRRFCIWSAHFGLAYSIANYIISIK
eukprot:snap_masked-scaffold_1-processed-gene-20.30-mRNA-1 protein AED:1.00 eAED:1.00 QI:0/-1/0/0/-1/1/1/0/73